MPINPRPRIVARMVTNQDKHRNDNSGGGAHALCWIHEAGHVHSQRCQFQTDDGYDGTHGCRREEDIYPFRSHFVTGNLRQNHSSRAKGDKAPLRIGIRHACGGSNSQHRGNESKAGPQISRKSPFTDGKIQQRADTIHCKADRSYGPREAGTVPVPWIQT